MASQRSIVELSISARLAEIDSANDRTLNLLNPYKVLYPTRNLHVNLLEGYVQLRLNKYDSIEPPKEHLSHLMAQCTCIIRIIHA